MSQGLGKKEKKPTGIKKKKKMCLGITSLSFQQLVSLTLMPTRIRVSWAPDTGGFDSTSPECSFWLTSTKFGSKEPPSMSPSLVLRCRLWEQRRCHLLRHSGSWGNRLRCSVAFISWLCHFTKNSFSFDLRRFSLNLVINFTLIITTHFSNNCVPFA